MSTNFDLNSLISDLKETTQQIDSTVQNISGSTNRLILEINKSQATSAKCQLGPKKHELLIKTTQEIVNIFATFKPNENRDANGSGLGNERGGGHGEAEGTFEEFRNVVEHRSEQIDKEVVKLNALQDIIQEIVND